MTVDCLLVFVVCQATFVQSDGITLPFTSLTYKSFPTNPMENLTSLENSGNAASPTKTDNVKNTEVNSSKTSLESPLQQSILKSIIKTDSNNSPFRTNSLDAQTKPREQIERPTKIRSFSPNIAITQASKLPPINLSNERSNDIKDNSISYSQKTRPFATPVNYLETSKNNHVGNLESSLSIGLSDVPHSTYKANQMNIQPKYLDCSKQTNLEFETNALNPVIQNLEKPKFVKDWENIQKDNLNKIKDNIDDSDVLSNIKLLQTINRQKHIEKKSSCKENIKVIEKPNAISKVLYPVDDIIFNSVSNLANANQVINAIQAETTCEKIYTNSNLAFNKNNVEIIDTPSVKFISDKGNAIPCNVERNDYEIINNVAIAQPVSPLNYDPSQIQSYGIYPYGAKEISKVYLRNDYTNHPKIAISLSGPKVLPASSSSSVYKVSDTYNIVNDEMIPQTMTTSTVNVPNNSNNCVMSKYLGKDSPNIIPSTSTVSTPAHTLEVPVLSQLPGVYTHVVSNPTNIIYNDVPDSPCVHSLGNRFPSSIGPNVDHSLVRSSENLNSLIPLLSNIDNISPCKPKSINQNYVKPSTYAFAPVKNNQPNLRPAENLNPDKLQLSPENLSYPSKSKVTKINLYSSPLTESLNYIISYFTTGLLSAFFDLNTKSDKPVSPISTDCPTISHIENDAPSYIYSEASISVAMPLFMLNPPQLPSPTFLPTPNVSPLQDCDNKSSPKRQSVVKKPKAYISSITINLIPSDDVNDVIVFV